MAQNKKRLKKPKHAGISPKAEFLFPHLTKANIDYGTDEYPKADGEYNVMLVLDEDQYEGVINELKESGFYEQAKEYAEEMDKARKPQSRKKSPMNWSDPGDEVYDDDEEPTGEYKLKFKSKASVKSRKTGKSYDRAVTIKDAKGRVMEKPPAIYGGSIGRVGYTAMPYFVEATGLAGITFYIDAVQVIKLETAGARNVEFEEEEGYEYSESDAEPDTEADTGDDDASFDTDEDSSVEDDEEDF